MHLFKACATPAVVGMLLLGSFTLPANAQMTEEKADSQRNNTFEIAQGSMCRQTRGEMVIYSEPSVNAEEVRQLDPGDIVTIVDRTAVQPAGENFRFIEVSSPMSGWVVSETRLRPGGPLESTLMMCPGSSTPPPIRGLW